jgi:UDP-GlcNAc3NAcA epimerase
MKIVTVVGARPQFIKAAPVGKVLRERGHREILVHTGQHYDYRMSQTFFEELGLAVPDVNLQVGSSSHAKQTGQMLIGIEDVLVSEQPDCVIVYGDTNSTLAGALAASKLGVRLAHVEAGLRSYNRSMPEEHNRVLTDHCSDLLLCPTTTARDNLLREGITSGVEIVGDPMYDAVLQFAAIARERSTVLKDLGVQSKGYVLVTIHRPYNTDNPETLKSIMDTMSRIGEPVIFPVHPRTRQRLALNAVSNRVKLVDPVGYLDMLALEQNARLIMTDSGGIQKEAYFFEVPCVTLRPETEWVETVSSGWNVLAGCDSERILENVSRRNWPSEHPPKVFGDGDAALRIAGKIEQVRSR